MNHFPLRDDHELVEEVTARSKTNADLLQLYPVCTALFAMIGEDAIDRWTQVEAENQRSRFCSRLVSQGFPKELVCEVWKQVVTKVSNGSSGPDGRRNKSMKLNVGDGHDSFDGLRSESANIFCFEAGRWIVGFAGKTVYPASVTGMKYLHRMISTPKYAFRPEELYQKVVSGTRRVRERQSASISASIAAEVGLSARRAKPDVLVDEQGRRAMLTRIDEIEQELKEAKRIPDSDLIERLIMERLKIVAYLKKAFTPLGSRKIQEPESVRKMKAIDIAVRRAKEKIKQAGHLELLGHLDEAITIRSRSGCCYRPLGDPVWRTEPTHTQPSTPNRPR